MKNEDNDSISHDLTQVINHIPKSFNKPEYLNYISKQSFLQLAIIQKFNNDNSVFSNKIIPNDVMNKYVAFNALSKKKHKLEGSQNNYFEESDDQNFQFEEFYQKMENMYQSKNNLIPYDSLSPFEENRTENIRIYIKKRFKKLLQHKNNSEEDNHAILQSSLANEQEIELKIQNQQNQNTNSDDKYEQEIDSKIEFQAQNQTYSNPEDQQEVKSNEENHFQNQIYLNSKTQQNIESNLEDQSKSEDIKNLNHQEIENNINNSTQNLQDIVNNHHDQQGIEYNHENNSFYNTQEENRLNIDSTLIQNQQKTENSNNQIKQNNFKLNEEIFTDQYQIIVQNIDLFFKSLYNIGYGHFALISKEIGIDSRREEISFYACTAAVIILFRLLPEDGIYTRYQNLILTLSNLFVKFNINMICNTVQNGGSNKQNKESKNFSKYNSFVKCSTEEAIIKLEPFYSEYLHNIDIEDFLTVLEVRSSFDNWLLFNKSKGKVEIPFDLLKPSKFSQLDHEIASCLSEHKEFSDKMKLRIDDFAYLFTYLNITEGLDKRIIIDDWTKPEIEQIKMALLNFGSDSISSFDFISKTCIITKSFRGILTFTNKIVKLLHSESEIDTEIDVFDDETIKEINFNTVVYKDLKRTLLAEDNNEFNTKEVEFMKLVLNHGVNSFNSIFLDQRYNFKKKLHMFANFDEFVSRIANKTE